jgi:hypothetical protein
MILIRKQKKTDFTGQNGFVGCHLYQTILMLNFVYKPPFSRNTFINEESKIVHE